MQDSFLTKGTILGISNVTIIDIYGFMQSETEQRPHKVSFYVDKDKAQTVTQKLSEIFKNRGVRFKFRVRMMSHQIM